MVEKCLKLELTPNDEKIREIEQNIGDARFVYNHLLSNYNELRRMFNDHGYPLYPNEKTLNSILLWLKELYPFLKKSDSTNLQQARRDLEKAFKNYFNGNAGYPKFKSKKNSKKSFRIQKVGNNIRVSNKRIRLAKIRFVHYRTSKEYRKLLKTCPIKNVTVKKENGKYYAMVLIEAPEISFKKTNKNVGIDLGFKTLATYSTGEKKANLNLKKVDERIKKLQRKLSRQKRGGKNYKKTLKRYHKWVDRRNNIIENTYHQISIELVKNFDIIAMEKLNIKGMFQNKKWAHKLQSISLYKLLNKIKYKAEWYGKNFIQVGRFFSSSQLCHSCGYKFKELTLDIREWNCPKCGELHDRDINAAINIRDEGIRLLSSGKKVK